MVNEKIIENQYGRKRQWTKLIKGTTPAFAKRD
jgi:hypothetical protein